MDRDESQINNFDASVLEQLAEAGLSADLLAEHQKNVSSFIASGSSRFFPIKDTCRLDNGGIWKLPDLAPNPVIGSDSASYCGVVAFVPAAGASSRYLAPLARLKQALTIKSQAECVAAIEELTSHGLTNAPLPNRLSRLIAAVNANQLKGLLADADIIRAEMEVPKALYPAVSSGETFLEVKRYEHRAIGGVQGEIYVSPVGRAAEFMRVAQKVQSDIPVRCYEQGNSLSTVRFNGAGQLAQSSEGRVSFVPGGHGALIRLFSRVTQDFPKARALFIRNIDNLSGTSTPVIGSTNLFLDVFRTTLERVDKIRSALRSESLELASDHAEWLRDFWRVPADNSGDPLRAILQRLFHSVPSSPKDLIRLFERPLVLMGQVPNTGNDVGGSCVFATVDGIEQKICLELPHASTGDRQKFLEDHSKATHFNPVFVATELPSASMVRVMEKNPFWLVAQKKWEGRDVFYQESILYELLGSSQYTNAIFAEIPRILFNPHKTLSDAKNMRLSDWIAN